MIGFEKFDIKAWLVDGFTRHIDGDAIQQSGRKRQQIPKLVVGISILAAMASVNEITVPAASAAQTEIIWPRQSVSGHNDWIAQPDKFWPALMQEISSWDDVEEHDSEDFPTIF